MTAKKPTDSQQQAINHNDGNMVILAVAGSGKTFAMVQRAARLVRERVVVNSQRILMVTFTNKAAENMISRLDDLCPGHQIEARTFHSFCFRVLREFDRRFAKQDVILDDSKAWMKTVWAETVMDEMGLSGDTKPSDIIRIVEDCKARGVHPDHIFDNDLLSNQLDEHEKTVYAIYDREQRKRGKFDFSDMEVYCFDLLRRNPSVRRQVQAAYLQIMVDEYQDTSPVQELILEMIGGCPNPTLPEFGVPDVHPTVVVVGDDDQCQPGDTKVALPGGDTIPLKNLDPREHKLVSYDIQHSTCVGVARAGRGFEKASRQYDGPLATLTAGGRRTRVTSTHKCVVRFNETYRTEDRWVTYLMRRRDNYRVGWCKLRREDNVFHPRVRMNLEDADALWILQVHDNAADASLMESRISYAYGISQMPFVQPRGADHYTQERLDRFWDQACQDKKEEIDRLTSDFTLNLNYPTCQRGDANTSGKTVHTIPACNVLSGLMEVPLFVGTKIPHWETVTVTWNRWIGEVFSLDVTGTETYVADGIITHNSIYGFRRAIPQFIINFQEKWDASAIFMEENFRSHQQILDVANRLISVNKDRVGKQLKPMIGRSGSVVVMASDDHSLTVLEELQRLRLEDDIAWDQVAILYRTNAQSCMFESRFTEANIPYICLGQRDGFYGMTEVKTLIAYLRLFVDPDNFEALRYVWNRPTRFLKNDMLMSAKAGSDSPSALDILEGAESLAGRNHWKVHQLRQTIERGIEDVESGMAPFDVLDRLIADIDYREWLTTVSEKTGKSMQDLEQLADRVLEDAYGRKTVGEFLEHVNRVIENSRKKERGDAVKLMTLHRSKGLEFPIVFFVGMTKDFIPHPKCVDREEERRLTYVGCTRAERRLYCVTSPINQSPFLAEMGLTVPRAPSLELPAIDEDPYEFDNERETA